MFCPKATAASGEKSPIYESFSLLSCCLLIGSSRNFACQPGKHHIFAKVASRYSVDAVGTGPRLVPSSNGQENGGLGGKVQAVVRNLARPETASACQEKQRRFEEL